MDNCCFNINQLWKYNKQANIVLPKLHNNFLLSTKQLVLNIWIYNDLFNVSSPVKPLFTCSPPSTDNKHTQLCLSAKPDLNLGTAFDAKIWRTKMLCMRCFCTCWKFSQFILITVFMLEATSQTLAHCKWNMEAAAWVQLKFKATQWMLARQTLWKVLIQLKPGRLTVMSHRFCTSSANLSKFCFRDNFSWLTSVLQPRKKPKPPHSLCCHHKSPSWTIKCPLCLCS